jgi:tetratricopeptide (TPR) repeat protein
MQGLTSGVRRSPHNQKGMESQKARFKKLEAAYDRELYSCSIELGKRYLTDYPNDILARLLYGIALRKLARYAEARRAIQRVIKACSKKWLHLPYAQMGMLYDDQGNLERAAHWFRKSIEARPSDATYRIFLGSVLARRGSLTEAEECHRRATKCTAGAIDEAYFNLGLVLRAREKYEAAMDAFQKALELDPSYKAVKEEMKDVEKVLGLRKQV